MRVADYLLCVRRGEDLDKAKPILTRPLKTTRAKVSTARLNSNSDSWHPIKSCPLKSGT